MHRSHRVLFGALSSAFIPFATVQAQPPEPPLAIFQTFSTPSPVTPEHNEWRVFSFVAIPQPLPPPPFAAPEANPPAFMALERFVRIAIPGQPPVLKLEAWSSHPPIGDATANPPDFLPGQSAPEAPALFAGQPPHFVGEAAPTAEPPIGTAQAILPDFLITQQALPEPPLAEAPSLPDFLVRQMIAESVQTAIEAAPVLPPVDMGAIAPPLPAFEAPPVAQPPVGMAVATLPAFLAPPDAPAAPSAPPFGAAVVPPDFVIAATPQIGAMAGCQSLAAPLRLYFDTKGADLTSEDMARLQSLSRQMKECPMLSAEVSGHTDIVGTPERNMALAKRRAMAVVERLEAEGIAPNRLVWVAKGQDEPIASNETAEGRALNRRIEIMLR